MKLSIVGMGRVGSAIAFASVLRGLANELVLVGEDREVVVGDALDLQHASAFVRPVNVRAGAIDDTENSDVVVIAASRSSSGGPRTEHARANGPLVGEISAAVATGSPRAILLVITNPVDVMTYLAIRASGFPPSRVIGSGTLLDTGRFRALLSRHSGVHTHDIRAYILGEHGDTQFPAMSVASYGGVRFDPRDPAVREMAEQARKVGYLVYQHKKHTNYGIASAAVMILHAIASDTREVLPVSTLIDGYLGVRDVCLSVPCVIGREGVVRMLPIDLDPDESARFLESARAVRKVIDDVGGST
jgi:L-lactate dehydrogenase